MVQPLRYPADSYRDECSQFLLNLLLKILLAVGVQAGSLKDRVVSVACPARATRALVTAAFGKLWGCSKVHTITLQGVPKLRCSGCCILMLMAWGGGKWSWM